MKYIEIQIIRLYIRFPHIYRTEFLENSLAVLVKSDIFINFIIINYIEIIIIVIIDIDIIIIVIDIIFINFIIIENLAFRITIW